MNRRRGKHSGGPGRVRHATGAPWVLETPFTCANPATRTGLLWPDEGLSGTEVHAPVEAHESPNGRHPQRITGMDSPGFWVTVRESQGRLGWNSKGKFPGEQRARGWTQERQLPKRNVEGDGRAGLWPGWFLFRMRTQDCSSGAAFP